MQLSAVQMTTPLPGLRATDSRERAGAVEAMTTLAVRVHGEYLEMPGLRLTVRQAARLFSLAPDVAEAVLHELRRRSILARADDGAFFLIGEGFGRIAAPCGAIAGATVMSTQFDPDPTVKGSLREASVGRLACLLRHWTWADEARGAFDRELAHGWDYDEDPMSDRPCGAYYHWCALLCAFGEAALVHGLLPPFQLEPIRQDIEATLPGLRACRELLVVIPDSLKAPPRIVELLGDDQTLPRLRRVHEAFGEALRNEQVSRQIDSLDS
jgi:hypothetical protein